MNSLHDSQKCQLLVMDYDRYSAGSFDEKLFNRITSDDVELEYREKNRVTHANGREAVSQLLFEKYAYNNAKTRTRKGFLCTSYVDGKNTVILKLEIKPRSEEADNLYKVKKQSIFKFSIERDEEEHENYKINQVITTVNQVPESPCKDAKLYDFSEF